MPLIVVDSKEDVISNLMDVISSVAKESISNNGVFTIGVSGGSLATFLCNGLPKIDTDFSKWKIFFCDERLVEEDNPDSTFGFYKRHLLDAVSLKEDQFVKVKQGVTPQEAAADYIQQMTHQFPGVTYPAFDLLLLGMGPDGHTCSLFPNHRLLEENIKWVAPITDSPKPPPNRITLTFPVINNARNCVFAMCGKEKADMVKRILVDKEDLPATRVKPSKGELYWILDKEAGSLLA